MKNTSIKNIVALALLASFAAGCGSSEAPEETVQDVIKLQMDRKKEQMESEIDKKEWRIECAEKRMEWFADKGTRRKKIDEDRAELEFYEDNVGDMADSLTYDIVDIQQPDSDNPNYMTVTVKWWQYEVEKGNGPKDFYLKYDDSKETFHLVKNDGDWKLKKESFRP